MFAAIALVLTLGPIIAISSPTHIGPLSSLGLIMSPASPDDGKLASCLAGMARTDCFFQFNLLPGVHAWGGPAFPAADRGDAHHDLRPVSWQASRRMGVHHRRAGGILHRDAVLFRGASVPRVRRG